MLEMEKYKIGTESNNEVTVKQKTERKQIGRKKYMEENKIITYSFCTLLLNCCSPNLKRTYSSPV